MMARAVVVALLMVTAAMHLYQFVAAPPAPVRTVTVLFGAVYAVLAIAVAFGARRALAAAQGIAALGAILAVASVFLKFQAPTATVVFFVALDFAIIWCSAFARAERAGR
jgi:hypothetical protein